jgi:ABC-2 type transport system permease protein
MSTDTAHSTARPAVGRGGLGAWRNQVLAFAIRYARELFRNKTVLFWTIAFPVGFYLLTITVFVDTQSIPADVLPYVKSGTAVTYGTFGAIIASLNSFGQQLAMDFEDDRYQLYRSLPIAPSADLAGRMIAGIVLSFVAFAIVVAAAVGTGGTFSLASAASIPLAVVAMLAFAIFWMVVAVLVTTAVRDARYASIVTVSMALALYFLTGYNGGSPDVFQGPDVVLNWLPNTLPTRLIGGEIAAPPAGLGRETALASPDPVIGTLTLLGYAVLALIVGLAVMRRIVYQRGLLP